MSQEGRERPPHDDPDLESVIRLISRMARDATIEFNVHDLQDLEASRPFLLPGKKIYVSFLPTQSWQQTEAACRALNDAGFDPVPHVPVRLLSSADHLSDILGSLVREANLREVLLIAGDYADPVGPFACVADVLRSGLLNDHGIRRLSVAGHPEGHPKVAIGTIREAEREKVGLALRTGLDVTLVTQIFFDSAPFLDWVKGLCAGDIRCHIRAGLAGPAKITTLFKFALRCGVGPSIRALGARPAALMKLVGEHGPQRVMRELAEARVAGTIDFAGLHFFCFGGYLRTCRWLHEVSTGGLTLNDGGGFESRGNNYKSRIKRGDRDREQHGVS